MAWLFMMKDGRRGSLNVGTNAGLVMLFSLIRIHQTSRGQLPGAAGRFHLCYLENGMIIADQFTRCIRASWR